MTSQLPAWLSPSFGVSLFWATCSPNSLFSLFSSFLVFTVTTLWNLSFSGFYWPLCIWIHCLCHAPEQTATMNSHGYSIWLLRRILCHSLVSLLLLSLSCWLLCPPSLECPRPLTSNFSHLSALIWGASSTVPKAEETNLSSPEQPVWHLHRCIQYTPQMG